MKRVTKAIALAITGMSLGMGLAVVIAGDYQKPLEIAEGHPLEIVGAIVVVSCLFYFFTK